MFLRQSPPDMVVDALRRLFSTFAAGPPGVGLLVLRVACGATLIGGAIPILQNSPTSYAGALQTTSVGLGLLLIFGLWTPVAASLAAIDALLTCLSGPALSSHSLLLPAVSASLALVGPGAWSVDARLFGWKRIDIDDGKR